MTTTEQNAEVQRLRAFIDARKRSIEAAERRYDVQAAVAELSELAAPLRCPERFSAEWKILYLEVFYRDVVAFLLSFVAVHLEICLSERDRELAFDVFFDVTVVPSSRAISALAATLSATKIRECASDKAADEDAEASISQCIRLLENVVTDNGVEDVVAEMLMQEQQQPTPGGGLSVIGLQVLISQLSSLPDHIYNRRMRDTPAVFRPRRYFAMLCDGLFHGFFQQNVPVKQSPTFRMFVDKLTRIGHTQALVQSWLRASGTALTAEVNRTLFMSLPESCHEQILLQLESEKTPESLGAQHALALPKYQLLAQLPPALCANKHFQYVVAHKLLLRRPMEDLFFWRVLADAMAKTDGDLNQSPLAAVFDVVLTRWSQSDFPVNTEYTINASVCFFLRYSLQKLAKSSDETAFSQDWITKLCKGVQDHMSHSLERVRSLGMRVGESLSHVIAAEKPLDFGLEDEDPLAVYGCPVAPEELAKSIASLDLDASSTKDETQGSSGASGSNRTRARRNPSKKRSPEPFTLDPDELVLSDEEEDDVSEEGAVSACSLGDFDSDSDSDMSLEAFELQDDEEDLTAKRPLYLKDLVAGLLSDDDREKTEAALTEVEALLRRRPRDLNDKAHEVARALLRLEDKYSTPQFVKLRSQALATTCALAPTRTVPYLCSQALEREQLLQSRIDALQAMTSAAQELSERGGGYQRPPAVKALLQEQLGASDLETRTMQSLKTRRWGYRRDPLAAPKKNAFAPFALEFFSPLLFGYVEYVRKHSVTPGTSRSDVEQTFLAHLLHALASFVECAGHAPQTLAMAKCLLEFAWSERSSSNAEVRRQVLFSLSRVLLVVSPAMLRQELGEALADVAPWLHQVQQQDPDAGCREAAKLLGSFASPSSMALR